MYDRQPHGMPGAAYAWVGFVLIFIAASIIMDVIGIFIIAAPLSLVLIVTPIILMVFFGFASWLTQARGGEG